MINPIGIDIKEPYLSWNCADGRRQTAYEIVAMDENCVVWDSSRVKSDSMHTYCPLELKSRQRISWKIRLWDERDEAGEWSEEAFFEMGLLDKSDWMAKWINPESECNPEAHKPASYLRTHFQCDEKILNKSVRLYVTAHGLYEVWINGKRAGDFVLAPGSYNYDKRLAYQTYNVSGLLCEGRNEVEVILGDGWYRSVSGVDGDRNIYGTDIALLFQLEADGRAVCVSDETWEASQNGAIRQNDMQQGEIVDARLAEVSEYHEVKVEDFSFDQLICSDCVPVCEMEYFKGKIITTPNGETVIDFGQNLAGYVEFTLNAHEGDTIVLTHGETLDENGNFTQENFQDRKRHKEGGTKQQVVYTCAEGENHYKTKFSIWGFRYAKADTVIDLSDASFTAIAVYSKMDTLTTFTCGNDDINRLVQNSIWSQKSNFCDVPTDCPTRERAAWTGDMGVFAHTGLYLMDAYPVMRKWLAECRVSQFDDGKIANISPKNNNPSFFSGLLAGSVGWGDACIIVPYEMYRRYGDARILSENYEMMKKWYVFLEERAKKRPVNPVKRFKRNPYRRYTIETGVDYGEWCEPDVESTSAMRTPQGKVATAFFAYSGRMLAEIAAILGKEDDAAYYSKTAEMAKKAWRFIATEDGKISSDRQAPPRSSPPSLRKTGLCHGMHRPVLLMRFSRAGRLHQVAAGKAKADSDGGIHLLHHRAVHAAHSLPQAALIQRADLLQQDHGILGQAAALRRQGDMSRQLGLPQLGGDGRRDDRGAVAVAGVVLHDQHRTHAPLLAAHHGAEIGVVYVAASDIRIHKVHTPPQEVPEGYVLRSLPLSHAAAEFIPFAVQ